MDVSYASLMYVSYLGDCPSCTCFSFVLAPLLVVPTELTDYTEAYGLKLLESTDRIDAARHTTEGTEMIAC